MAIIPQIIFAWPPDNSWIPTSTDPLPDAVEENDEQKSVGQYCVKCGEYYPMAEPNQSDGSLICFACRKGY